MFSSDTPSPYYTRNTHKSIKNPTNFTLRKISKHPNLFVRLTFAHLCLQNSTNPQPYSQTFPKKTKERSIYSTESQNSFTSVYPPNVSAKCSRCRREAEKRVHLLYPGLFSAWSKWICTWKNGVETVGPFLPGNIRCGVYAR